MPDAEGKFTNAMDAILVILLLSSVAGLVITGASGIAQNLTLLNTGNPAIDALGSPFGILAVVVIVSGFVRVIRRAF